MATLRQILDDTILLLQNPGYKTPGAIRKSQYQHSKDDEDKLIRSIMYEGQIVDPELVKRQQKAKKANPKYKEIHKKAAQTRAAWYKDPENYEKFKAAIKKRDKAKRKSQSTNKA